METLSSHPNGREGEENEGGREVEREGGRPWKSRKQSCRQRHSCLKVMSECEFSDGSMSLDPAGISIQAQMPWSQHCGTTLASTTCV